MTKAVSSHTLDPIGPLGLGLVFFYGKIKISQRFIKAPEKNVEIVARSSWSGLWGAKHKFF